MSGPLAAPQRTSFAYLRSVRLRHAREKLRAGHAQSGTTVRAVAARWGFAKPDRFAANYRSGFGELPNHTLRS